eukprot:TRINITY_DN10879_c0_g1_i1.p2 TRINITY_DN10879_c0_g1~~TRINITY_DN10879_c0_g1_i1.p2  ORF type:complete len:562 (+),score=170.80 TRINITY_DN10879_c0_g1_i1:86-1771(+)
MERCAAEQQCAQQCGGVDTEEPISLKGTQVAECPAPPPRRLARPVLGLRSGGPSVSQSGTPSPRDDGQDDACTTPRDADDPAVELLTQENRRLRGALAAAAQQVRELTAQLEAATAPPQGSPRAAGHAAAEGGQPEAGQQSGGRSRRRRRKRQKQTETPAVRADREEAVELRGQRDVEEKVEERAEAGKEEKEEPLKKGEEKDDEEKDEEQGDAGGDPDPEPELEQGQDAPQQQQQQQQHAVGRPPTPLAEQCDSVGRAVRLRGPSSATPWAEQCDDQGWEAPPLRSPPVGTVALGAGGFCCSDGAPPPCWLCLTCGLANAAETAFCGNPRCGMPQAGDPAGDGLCHLGPDASAAGIVHGCSAQPGVPLCGGYDAVYQGCGGLAGQGQYGGGTGYQQCYAPPPPRYAPPLQGMTRRVYAAPVANLQSPLLVPMGPPSPPAQPVSSLPPPAPTDPRQLMGTALYTRVAALCPKRAPKLTGMLLEVGSGFVSDLLTDPDLLASQVWEAWEVLAAAECPQRPAAPPPVPPPPAPCAAAPPPAHPSPGARGRYLPPHRRRLLREA